MANLLLLLLLLILLLRRSTRVFRECALRRVEMRTTTLSRTYLGVRRFAKDTVLGRQPFLVFATTPQSALHDSKVLKESAPRESSRRKRQSDSSN